MTVSKALRLSQAELEAAGDIDAKTDAWLIVSFYCKIDKNAYYMEPERKISPSQLENIKKAISLRTGHVPLQHIIGVTEFFGHSFFVNENVLCPRMETEQLVLEVLYRANPEMKILDLCTGSGCIAISLALEDKDLHIDASDISDKALELARKNADLNGVRINFIKSDIFENIPAKETNGGYDVIVSNPPYIPTRDIEGLMPEVRDYEPHIALDGGVDGYDFYKRIIAESPSYLAENGLLIFEIGYDQGETLRGLFESEGFCDIRILKDIQGLDRIAAGIRRNEDV